MSQRLSHRTFAWVLVTLCLLAIPVGLSTRTTQTSLRSERDSDASISSFALKFEDRIQVIRLAGMIMDKPDGLWSSTSSATAVINKLRKAAKNNRIKGVLLRINSPGGTIATSQELHQAVDELTSKGKPVVASMGDVAASGGYYAACACDEIVANPGTLTGSIGVIMDLMNLKGLADKLGIQPQVIKSGPFKDIASPFRPLSPAETAILQSVVKSSYNQFISAVAKGRKMDLEKVRKIADGRVYLGQQALALGLVDKLGSYDDALDELQKICKKKYHLIRKLPVDEGSTESIISTLLEASAKLSHQDFKAINFLPQSLDPKFHKQPLWLMQ